MKRKTQYNNATYNNFYHTNPNQQYKSNNKKIIIIASVAFILLFSVVLTIVLLINGADGTAKRNPVESILGNSNAYTSQNPLGELENLGEHNDEINRYLKLCNSYLDEGRIKDALYILYECEDRFPDYDIDKEIDNFFERVTYAITVSPDKCDEEHSFTDSTVYDEYWAGCPQTDFGVQLCDNITGEKETLITVTVPCGLLEENDGSIIFTKNDKVVFRMWIDVGAASTFLYSIKDNKFSILSFTYGGEDSSDDYILLRGCDFVYGDTSGFDLYDWDGNLLTSGSTVGTASLSGEWIYYVNSIKSVLYWDSPDGYSTFIIEKVKADGSCTEEVCTVRFSSKYFINLRGNVLHCGDYSINLTNPYDAIIDDEGLRPYELTPEEELRQKLDDATTKSIIEFQCADYDKDGRYEAFAIVSDKEPPLTSLQGELWIVSEDEVRSLGDKVESIEYWERASCSKITDTGDNLVVIVTSYYTMTCHSKIWTIVDGEAKKCELSDLHNNGASMGENHTLVVEYSVCDGTEGTIRTWKDYYYYWDSHAKDFREYGGALLTQEQFSKIEGGADILDGITSDGRIVKEIYYRANDIINVNYVEEYSGSSGTCTYNYWNSYIYDEETNTLTAITDYDGLGNMGYYLSALNEEIATYPSSLPHVFND